MSSAKVAPSGPDRRKSPVEFDRDMLPGQNASQSGGYVLTSWNNALPTIRWKRHDRNLEARHIELKDDIFVVGQKDVKAGRRDSRDQPSVR
jgi:hypothetical protein